MQRSRGIVVLAMGLSVLLHANAQSVIESAPLVAPFSAGRPGAPLPPGWQMVRITEQKRLTVYDLVADQGVTVLRARAEAAASALAHASAFDLRAAPIVHWRWRVSRLIDDADNRIAAREDSPVRLLFEFDGDKTRLSLSERAVFMVSRAASGHELPYATLMYIWSNQLPVGTIVPNPRTRRIQMVVAASGAAGVGRWLTLERDVYQDYVAAFGEQPGRLTGVGLLTDTDNTGESVEAWYGDIRFEPPGR